jgi:hypothetical protein
VKTYDMVVAGHQVVQFGSERPFSALAQLPEVSECGVLAPLFAGQAASAADMPDNVVGKDLGEFVHVAGVE